MITLPAGITPKGTGKAGPSEDVKWNISANLLAEGRERGLLRVRNARSARHVRAAAHPSDPGRIHLHAGGHVRSLSRWSRGPRPGRATSCACRAAFRMATTIERTSRRARCSGSHRRESCARCSTSCTISAIPKKSCGARPRTKWISCRRAVCRGERLSSKSEYGLRPRASQKGPKTLTTTKEAVRLHPASPALSVVVQATEPFGSTPPSEPIW